jgi:glycosyltransferase involved in cell wall biosynthesis
MSEERGAPMRVLHVGWGFRPWRVGGLIAYAEDLMASQVARGHTVGYFFQGRHYPLVQKVRMKRWHRAGVAMYELMNAPQRHGGDLGTSEPAVDIAEPLAENAFREVLREFQPELVHFQELGGMPSSLIPIARGEGVPTVMSLEDYAPLCPTVKLYDSLGQNCKRLRPGDQCVECCAGAPAHTRHLVMQTMLYHAVPGGSRGLARFGDLVSRLRDNTRIGRFVITGLRRRLLPNAEAPPARSPASAEAYDRRRAVNVERLSELDLVLAMSRRVAEIYAELGVRPDALRTLQFTLRHLESLHPSGRAEPQDPLRIVTLNGCASEAKGAALILSALELLESAGLADRFRLIVLGSVASHYAAELDARPNVELRGHYTSDELSGLLDEFDVGLMPSVWEEAYGYTGVEMLAKGLPVIANRLGGMTEYVVEGRTGWLNDDSSAEGLAAIVERLVRAPEQVTELRRGLIDRHYEIVKPMDVHVREIEDVYGELAGSLSYR